MLRNITGRGLLRAQSTKILAGASNNAKFSTTSQQQSVQASYDWTSKDQAKSFAANSEQSASDFQSILSEIKERFIRVDVPAKHRNFVFRPRNAQLLKSAPIADKEGHRYTPLVWKGPPSGVRLLELMEKATDKEAFQAVKEILLRYLKHYPHQVQSRHFEALLRASATTGDLFDNAIVDQPLHLQGGTETVCYQSRDIEEKAGFPGTEQAVSKARQHSPHP